MATVIVEGHGTFSVNSENLIELIQLLETNNAAQVENNQQDPTYGGDTLLNE